MVNGEAVDLLQCVCKYPEIGDTLLKGSNFGRGNVKGIYQIQSQEVQGNGIWNRKTNNDTKEECIIGNVYPRIRYDILRDGIKSN